MHRKIVLKISNLHLELLKLFRSFGGENKIGGDGGNYHKDTNRFI